MERNDKAMKNRRLLQVMGAVVLAVATLGVPSAWAHEGHDHGAEEASWKGTVQSINGQQLVLKGVDGKSVTVHFDQKTQYETGGAAGSASDVVAGMRVVIHGEKMSDGVIHAEAIRYSRDAKKAKGHG